MGLYLGIAGLIVFLLVVMWAARKKHTGTYHSSDAGSPTLDSGGSFFGSDCGGGDSGGCGGD